MVHPIFSVHLHLSYTPLKRSATEGAQQAGCEAEEKTLQPTQTPFLNIHCFPHIICIRHSIRISGVQCGRTKGPAAFSSTSGWGVIYSSCCPCSRRVHANSAPGIGREVETPNKAISDLIRIRRRKASKTRRLCNTIALSLSNTEMQVLESEIQQTPRFKLYLLNSISISKHDMIPICPIYIEINLSDIWGASSCLVF